MSAGRDASPEAWLAKGRVILAAQPFSVLLGAELRAFAPGQCELHVPITDPLRQQYGFAHGGVVSYAADNALTFAGGSMLDGDIVTAEFKINYTRPAIGERLIARARAVHAGRSQAVCTCEIFAVVDGTEKLCALAQGTITRLPDRTTA